MFAIHNPTSKPVFVSFSPSKLWVLISTTSVRRGRYQFLVNFLTTSYGFLVGETVKPEVDPTSAAGMELW